MTLSVLSLLGLGASGAAAIEGDRLMTDFSGKGLSLQWFSLNDGVMGGRSSGTFRVEKGVLVFLGTLNTNGGGFASIRTRAGDLSLKGAEGIHLRVRGDGRTYSVRLQESERGRSVSYRAKFATQKGGGWTDVWLPFRSFVPTWRGRVLDRAPLDPARMRSLGITLADGKDGAFRLEVDAIGAYAPFSLEGCRWKSRLLVAFAPKADDAKLATQLRAVEKESARFVERDMKLVIVLENSGTTGSGRPISATTAAALRKRFDVKGDAFAVRLIGKDGGVKRSGESPFDLDAIFAQIDKMPMRRAEMAKRDAR